jgi:salicylate hydroxylase
MCIFLKRNSNQILEQSSLLHEVGAAITIKPNASRVLASWDFVPENSGMVVLRGMSLIDGTNMKTLVPMYYKDCESSWGMPMYAVHRVDLHSQLRQLATQEDGPGRPCDVRVRSKVVDYDAEKGTVTTEKCEVLQADLVVAADGVHSAAVRHVLDDEGVVQAEETGWACMRWLVPREDIIGDPETSHMIQDSATRYFTAAEGAAGLVWYPCRKYVL